jgi:hypothetical protein
MAGGQKFRPNGIFFNPPQTKKKKAKKGPNFFSRDLLVFFTKNKKILKILKTFFSKDLLLFFTKN